jgi:hypothetical protein
VKKEKKFEAKVDEDEQQNFFSFQLNKRSATVEHMAAERLGQEPSQRLCERFTKVTVSPPGASTPPPPACGCSAPQWCPFRTSCVSRHHGRVGEPLEVGPFFCQVLTTSEEAPACWRRIRERGGSKKRVEEGHHCVQVPVYVLQVTWRPSRS